MKIYSTNKIIVYIFYPKEGEITRVVDLLSETQDNTECENIAQDIIILLIYGENY